MSLINLSPAEARKLSLVNHGLNRSDLPRGLNGARKAFRQIGYLQIDTISIVERAHHHTLWNRVPHYRRHFLDQLVEQRDIFEYWAHAAAYLPIEHFRFCLPRMQALASGQRHWYQRDPKLMKQVLSRVRSDGPLQAKDFDNHHGPTGMWEWGPIKQAMEQLFMEGSLMVTRRDSFQKVFDLTERVLPDHIDKSTPSTAEFCDFLIERFLTANGIGKKSEFGYLQKGIGPDIQLALQRGVDTGKLFSARVGKAQDEYYVANNFTDTLQGRLTRQRVRLLSPFDNLIIQRDRAQRLFGFDYQLECYVPAPKRKFGYFCLPILWQDKLVGRMDAKADRKTGVFEIRLLKLDFKPPQFDAFLSCLAKEIRLFASYCDCTEFKPLKVDKELKGELKTALSF
ncbi:MAG: hypothetical protein ACI8P9_002823 [Parasphingorhabdus sp.]|jgi:uncharacterized protein YcaQ